MLELSVSLILNPEYLGFYAGTVHVAADPARDVESAHAFMIKFWFIMFQITLYGQT